MKVLILRPYNYNDYRQGIMREIDRLWAALPRPNNVAVLQVSLPKKAQKYPHAGCGIPFLFRWWVALRELDKSPADWVFVFDADVFPMRQDALFVFCDFVRETPQSVGVISSTNLSFLGQRDVFVFLGISCEGIAAGFGDGIKGVRAEIAAKYTTLYFHYAYSIRNQNYHSEATEGFITYPTITVRFVPPHILLPIHYLFVSAPEYYTAAFLQVLDDQSKVQSFILQAAKNIIG